MARVAFVLPDLRGGGAERVTLTLVNDLAARGYQVDLVLMQKSGQLLDDVSPSVNIVDLKARRTRNVIRPLMRYLRRRRPDAIQISLWPLTVVGIIAARLSGLRTRLIVSDHMTLSQQYGRQRLVMILLRVTTRIVYPFADARVCVSHGSARDLANLSGLPQSKFAVIYNPVEERRASSPACDRSRDWQTSGARILAVGTLKHQKNHELLIKSLSRLPKELDASLVIAGDGELRTELERQVRALGLERRVTFAGYVEHIGDYYRAADLFVLSSDYEGFALVVVEALHAGLRIVSTDCPDGPSEILEKGRYGILVPVGDVLRMTDAIELALQSPPEPERQKRRARDFSTRTASDQYLRLMLRSERSGAGTCDGDETVSERQLEQAAD